MSIVLKQQLLVAGFDNSNIPEFVTATLSPTPPLNELILAATWTHDENNAPPLTPTLAGNGLTWDQVATDFVDPGGSADGRLTIFRAMAGSGITSGAVTVTHSESVHGCYWAISAIALLRTSGVNGVDAIHDFYTAKSAVQVTGLTVTLDPFDKPNNRPWAAFAIGARDTAVNPSGQTEIAEVRDSGEVKTLETQWKPAGQDTTSRATWTGGSQVVGIALELVPAIIPVPVARRDNPLLRM